ncbi:hypothetical protein VIGAN_01512900 [Vigna angularis var. angularis]|uniref:Uncharacterized protein n=1 Tax=Vigna angularis var. angularis TaxID=157739 RepID=A0A0S3R8V6_PHAAN|nr:hypothetical protein VIGAN_01512900 [Vigna angularis var. angularis]
MVSRSEPELESRATLATPWTHAGPTSPSFSRTTCSTDSGTLSRSCRGSGSFCTRRSGNTASEGSSDNRKGTRCRRRRDHRDTVCPQLLRSQPSLDQCVARRL